VGALLGFVFFRFVIPQLRCSTQRVTQDGL
jgi:hypothetical protein